MTFVIVCLFESVSEFDPRTATLVSYINPECRSLSSPGLEFGHLSILSHPCIADEDGRAISTVYKSIR